MAGTGHYAYTATTGTAVAIDHYGVNPAVGMRIGSDACKRMVEKRHPLAGSIVQLAAEISYWSAVQNQLPDGSWREARRTATSGNGGKGPRVTENALIAAEEWYATHEKRPSDATLAAMVAAANAEGKGRDLLASLRAVVADQSTTDTHERERRIRRERRAAAAAEARKRTAKGKR